MKDLTNTCQITFIGDDGEIVQIFPVMGKDYLGAFVARSLNPSPNRDQTYEKVMDNFIATLVSRLRTRGKR